jgi:hypothetical protein
VCSKLLFGRGLTAVCAAGWGQWQQLLDHPETPDAVLVLCRLCCGLLGVEGYPEAKLVVLEPFPK